MFKWLTSTLKTQMALLHQLKKIEFSDSMFPKTVINVIVGRHRNAGTQTELLGMVKAHAFNVVSRNNNSPGYVFRGMNRMSLCFALSKVDDAR